MSRVMSWYVTAVPVWRVVEGIRSDWLGRLRRVEDNIKSGVAKIFFRATPLNY